ncbi:MAG: DUF4328 domain-containing protein [Pyrinomonadaceae bacterium]|nr:DUF4328 domain-containing protein [Acidobacteriota bacterium]MBK7933309.1 DUF4328 domain-containing protein [Acidobacteriota bacterium]MBP7374843.1 DUF4328 domain-containing protein [Pyrinomonadaceae bacterium]
MNPFRSPVLLSRLAIAGLGIVGVCRILFLVAGFGLVIDPSRSVDLGDSDQLSIWLLFSGLVSLVLLPAFIFSVVTFLMWLHRVFTNLHALRSDQTDFTPGWAVGWWFVPFANLVKPFQAVRTAWAESDPDADVDGGFLTGIQSSAPTFMGVWWAFWIIGNIISNLTGRLELAAKPGEEAILGYTGIVESLVWVVATILAIRVVLSITERQEARFARFGAVTIDTPPPPPKFSAPIDQQYGSF